MLQFSIIDQPFDHLAFEVGHGQQVRSIGAFRIRDDLPRPQRGHISLLSVVEIHRCAKRVSIVFGDDAMVQNRFLVGDNRRLAGEDLAADGVITGFGLIDGRHVRLIGSSGSTIEDLQRMLDLTESGRLVTNRSVAAIAGLDGAWDGMRALEEGRFPGKVLIYPHLRSLGLTALDEHGSGFSADRGVTHDRRGDRAAALR